MTPAPTPPPSSSQQEPDGAPGGKAHRTMALLGAFNSHTSLHRASGKSSIRLSFSGIDSEKLLLLVSCNSPYLSVCLVWGTMVCPVTSIT